MLTKRQKAAGFSLVFGISLAVGLGSFFLFPGEGDQGGHASHHAGHHETFTCSMHPNVVQDHEGTCPVCGMALVAVASGRDGAEDEGLVHVDTETLGRMGVRFQTVGTKDLSRTIEAFATISADASRTVSVTSKVEGWVKRLHVRGVGQRVGKGQVLYELYSPDLQQKQRDFIAMLTRRDAMTGEGMAMDVDGPNFLMLGGLARELFRMRDRLTEAGIPADVIAGIEKDRREREVIPVRAQQDGIVTAVSATEGSFVNPMKPVLVYTDDQNVWAEITLYPDQLGWIREGDRVLLTSGLDRTARVTTKVDLSTLQIDPSTRTAKLRFPVANGGDDFLPGGYAEAAIETGARRALAVPRDAVIRTGRGHFVVVEEDEGHFLSAPVTLGLEDETFVEILSGLEEGERIAVNGQFLLDAASSIQAMQARLRLARTSTKAPEETPEKANVASTEEEL